MRLNVSQLLDWQRCPVFWWNKNVARRGFSAEGALSDGLYFHTLAEDWLKGESLLPVSTNPTQDAMRHFVEEGRLPKLPAIAVEKQLEMPLGRHTLVGTLDGIMPADNGRFYSLQWKTCAGGQDMERQCDMVKYSYYEAAYEALMNHNGFPCAGTYLGVWKKLTKADQAAGVNPLSFHILERPVEYVAQIVQELDQWAATMSRTIEEPIDDPMPHRRSCIQGFMRCQYFDTCYNAVPLNDSRYIDIEDRYTKVEE